MDCGGHLRPLAVVLERAEVLGEHVRIADDPAVLLNEGHAGLGKLPEPIREEIPVDLAVRRQRIALGSLGHEVQAHVQILPDTVREVAFDGRQQVDLGCGQGDDEECQRDQEEFAARA